MTFVSHAANAEDVLLWRALGDRVERGGWIDVGAGDPDERSVTRALRDRGWTGINVDHDPARHARLLDRRLDDLNLRLTVGADADAAADPPRETLAGVAARRRGVPLHLLHVADPTGAEAVLAGADWATDRPWIVVVASAHPDTGAPLEAAWEPALRAAGYRFAWFDGLKRFYLAAEHDAALRPAFDRPPNPRDDWRPAAGADAQLARAAEQNARQAAAIARLNNDNGRLRTRLDATEALRLREKDGFGAELDWRLGIAERAADALRAEIASLRPHADRLDRLARELRLPDGPRALRLVLPAARVLRRALGGAAPPRPAATPPDAATPVEAPPAGATAPSSTARAEAPAPPPTPAPLLPSPLPLPAIAAATPPVEPAPATGTGGSGVVPRRAVHQYHHATADGDAISNAMLLTREHLREAGFASEIFVAIRDPAHAAVVRLVDELPAHDDHVLLVRHSFGDPLAERIAAGPAPRILHYHNITPPSLLGAERALADTARRGREQLVWWRPRVVAATADSPLNALELRRHGFTDPAVVPLLLDPARLRARAALARPVRRPDAPFTVLFVGRIVPSKHQDALVDAFARFHARFDRPSRLVLVGRGFGADDYAAAVRARVAASGLGDAVLFTGGVDDDTLDEWFARADVYASMSAHEGFGVPLIEAMAHGVPVLARDAGAIPDTVGDAAVLLPDDDPDRFAEALHQLATDPARRTALAARGDARLDTLDPKRGLARLLDVLRLAGAAPPSATAAAAAADGAAALAARMRVTVAGHVNGSYSLAAVNRALALALDRRLPGRVALEPVEGEAGAPLDAVPSDQFATLAALAGRRHGTAAPHLLISNHYPVWVPPEPPPGTVPPDRVVASFYWEETLVPPATIARLDDQFDAVLAPSRFVARALRDSGLRSPVHVIGHAPPLAALLALDPDRGRAAARPFTFLHVSSAFPRKGIDVLLAGWALAFGDAAPPRATRLLIKTFPNPHNDAAEQIGAFRAAHPDAPPIEHLDADLDDDGMRALWRDADAVVLPTRGEGFNIPAAEALAAALPLVVSAEGGHRDFLDERSAFLVAGDHASATTHLAAPGSLWFEPDPRALADALRAVLADPDAARARAAIGRAAVAARLAPDRLARNVEAALALVLGRSRPLDARRTTVVSTWDVRCGIAEYTRFLLDDRPPGAGGLVTVLADARTPAGTSNDVVVRPAWDRGDRFRPEALARAIAEADGEALLIEHQPGLFDWPDLAVLLNDDRIAGAAGGRAVAVALHNTAHLATGPAALRDAVHAALARADRVLVHTARDWDRLRGAGLDNVTVIPQGAPLPRRDDPIAAAAGPGRPPVIGAFGFLLPSKGIDRLIAALPALRARHPGTRLRLLCATYDADSVRLRDALVADAASRGLADAIDWHTEFLPRADVLAALAGCDAVALPYADTLESSSAALRTALGCGRPVAVTPHAIFDEAADAVFRFTSDRPDAIAAGLAVLLDDRAARDAIAAAARAWLAGRAWPVISRRVFGLLDGLVGEKRPGG